MVEFYPFFIIIFAGVFFSMVFRRVHIPWVVGLIVGGIIVGPHGFNVLTVTPTAEFIAEVGLVFLMFMAGLETKFSGFQGFQVKLWGLAFINGFVPFAVGFGLMLFLGYGWLTSLLVAIIFISSSIAVVIPSLDRYNLLRTRLGRSVILTTVLQDIASLILLSILLQSIDPITKLPLYIFYPLLILTLFVLRYVLKKVSRFFSKSVDGADDRFQQNFRTLFVMLLGTVIIFELLGLHSIIAGFFAGLVLTDALESQILKEKIRTISYGIFIPTFFILVGVNTDISLLFESKNALILVGIIVLGSIFSKFMSGIIGASMVGFNRDQSLLFGITSVPQLSTTLAVVFTSFSLGIVDSSIVTAMVALSIVTVLVSPILMDILGNRIQQSADK